MFLLAFYFGLRVGEITNSMHNIQFCNSTVTEDEVSIFFKSYNHSTNNCEQHTIRLSGKKHCPVIALNNYFHLRGFQEGPLFVLKGKAVTEKFFSSKLQSLTKLLKIDEKITPHSFRIGAASFWLSLGLTDYQIMKRGRWTSNAVLKYLRGEVDHSN